MDVHVTTWQKIVGLVLLVLVVVALMWSCNEPAKVKNEKPTVPTELGGFGLQVGDPLPDSENLAKLNDPVQSHRYDPGVPEHAIIPAGAVELAAALDTYTPEELDSYNSSATARHFEPATAGFVPLARTNWCTGYGRGPIDDADGVIYENQYGWFLFSWNTAIRICYKNGVVTKSTTWFWPVEGEQPWNLWNFDRVINATSTGKLGDPMIYRFKEARFQLVLVWAIKTRTPIAHDYGYGSGKVDSYAGP